MRRLVVTATLLISLFLSLFAAVPASADDYIGEYPWSTDGPCGNANVWSWARFNAYGQRTSQDTQAVQVDATGTATKVSRTDGIRFKSKLTATGRHKVAWITQDTVRLVGGYYEVHERGLGAVVARDFGKYRANLGRLSVAYGDLNQVGKMNMRLGLVFICGFDSRFPPELG